MGQKTAEKRGRIRKQPAEKVITFLETNFFSPQEDFEPGHRVPTTHELAKQLHVGVSTVQKVYQSYIKRGRLEAAPGRGTFVSESSGNRSGKILLGFGGMGDPATELWQTRISSAVLRAAGSCSSDISIVPFDPGEGTADWSDIQAAVLFPHPQLMQLLSEAATAKVPCVTLHPLTLESTSDFVSPDYIGGCRQIGDACIASGRQRIALVQAHPAGGSVSNVLRLSGFLSTIGPQLGDRVKIRVFDAPTASHHTGRQAAAKLFSENGFNPDLVFCMGDFLAHGFLSWLEDNHVDCPGRVSVIAGTGLTHDPDPFPGMTCLQQDLSGIGNELFRFALRRSTSGHPLPGVYLPGCFIGGATTLRSENELLRLDQRQ